MTIQEVERLGGCIAQQPTDMEITKQKILNKLHKGTYEDTYTEILEDHKVKLGPGPGFTGDELLSKDELNLIFDLEDEQIRLGDFTCIFPRPSTAAQYYGFAEVKRYQNALYCAWLSTGQAEKSQLVKKCQK